MCGSVSNSVVSDSVTAWTVAHQAPLSTDFFRQEYWSRLPVPSPGNLPNPGIEPRSPALQAVSLPAETQGKPFKVYDLSNSGIEPRSPALWADSLPAELQGKPKNTGAGSLSLL